MSQRSRYLPAPNPVINPLDVPEILLQALSYLPPSALRAGSNLVCKKWHAICLVYMINITTWDSNIVSKNSKEETIFYQRIRSTDYLRCHIQENRWGAKHAILSLTNVLKSLSRNEQNQRIQRLEVTLSDDSPQGMIVLNIFAPLRYLSSLRIRTQSIWTISSDRLLLVFPHLHQLDLGFMEPRLLDRTSRSHLSREHPNRPWPESVRALCSITFESMTVDMSLLESLLSHCPKLQELKLIAIQQQYQSISESNQDNYGNKILPQFDGRTYFKAITNHCPRLVSFHFSEAHCSLSATNIQAIADSFPNLESLSMIASSLNSLPDVSDSTVSTELRGQEFCRMSSQMKFLYIAQQLTTLELVADDQASTQWPSEFNNIRFHQLLCMTPNLRHLKASHVFLNTSMMDMNNWNSGEPFGVWSCKKLRTIEISLENMYRNQDQGQGQGDGRSRAFFAYLVNCCPKLQDVVIHFSDLEMYLPSGVCLLSELEDLRNLRIDSMRKDSVISELDVGWLSNRDLKDRFTSDLGVCKSAVRRMKIARNAEEQDSLWRYWSEDQGKRAGKSLEELNLRDAIWRASCLQGVAEVLEKGLEKQLKGKYCWPNLESILVRNDFMHLVQKLRPMS